MGRKEQWELRGDSVRVRTGPSALSGGEQVFGWGQGDVRVTVGAKVLDDGKVKHKVCTLPLT